MDTRESLLETLKQLEEGRDNAKAKFDDFNRAIEGIRLALKLVRVPSATGANNSGGLIQSIRHIITASDKDTTVEDVIEALKVQSPETDLKRASISSALARLADQKEIQLIQKGAGRRGAVYRRKGAAGITPPANQTAA